MATIKVGKEHTIEEIAKQMDLTFKKARALDWFEQRKMEIYRGKSKKWYLESDNYPQGRLTLLDLYDYASQINQEKK